MFLCSLLWHRSVSCLRHGAALLLLSHVVAELPETKEYNDMKEKVCLTTDATFEDFLDVLPTALEAVSFGQGVLEGYASRNS